MEQDWPRKVNFLHFEKTTVQRCKLQLVDQSGTCDQLAWDAMDASSEPEREDASVIYAPYLLLARSDREVYVASITAAKAAWQLDSEHGMLHLSFDWAQQNMLVLSNVSRMHRTLIQCSAI